MKAITVFPNRITPTVTILLFILLNVFKGNAQSFDPEIQPGINVTIYPLHEIIDSIQAGLETGFGRTFKLDSTFKTGAINYAIESSTGNKIDWVPGQAHFHRAHILDFVSTVLDPPHYFNAAFELSNSDTFSEVFALMEPDRFWVDTTTIGRKCYLILALDGTSTEPIINDNYMQNMNELLDLLDRFREPPIEE